MGFCSIVDNALPISIVVLVRQVRQQIRHVAGQQPAQPRVGGQQGHKASWLGGRKLARRVGGQLARGRPALGPGQ